ncbi:SBBP repeat-containing protein, partial [Dolichospermum sp. ST_sed3]|nr:SBBP repeat-containing protein [Dolichospermum sp. ST_sed3]
MEIVPVKWIFVEFSVRKLVGQKDYGRSIACDINGNIYIIGDFENTVDFNFTTGIDNYNSLGLGDIYITKINSNYTYGWTRSFMGSATEEGFSVSIDNNNDILFLGKFGKNVDLDPTSGSYLTNLSDGGAKIAISKFSIDGLMIFTTFAVGWNYVNKNKIFSDKNNNIYIIGNFDVEFDFCPGINTDIHIPLGGLDIYIMKLTSDGNYGWTKTIGGTGDDFCNDAAFDKDGNLYITGSFQGTVDFNPDAGVDNKTSLGGSDIYVTKFNPDGSYAWTKTIGNADNESANSIAVNSKGYIYITGSYTGTVDFDPGAGTDSHSSINLYQDIFITRLNSDSSYG